MARHTIRLSTLRGAKSVSFLLSALLVTTITSGIFARPTQAEFFQSQACALNIGTCTTQSDTAVTNPTDSTPPGDQTGQTKPSDPSDTTPPTVALSVTPTDIAGGPAQPTVQITGSVQDSNLASYALTVNGNVVQQGSDFTDPSAPIGITVAWSLRAPNVIPSGEYTVTLTATDQAGNTSPDTTISRTITVDNDAPVTTITGGGVLIQSGSITPAVTADDSHGVSYFWTADSTNPSKLAFNPTAATPTFTPDTQGTYTYTLTTTDSLGNAGIKNFTFDYAPVLATIPLPISSDPTIQLTGTGAASIVKAPIFTAQSIRSQDTAGGLDDDTAGLAYASTGSSESASVGSGSVITSTNSGWRILGMAWYWWLVVVFAICMAWLAGKKLLLNYRFKSVASVAELE